jgi:hypothetical protein
MARSGGQGVAPRWEITFTAAAFGTGYARSVHASGPITELTTLRLNDFEDRGVGSIAVVNTTTTDVPTEGNDRADRIAHWSAVADTATERVEAHGASAEEAAKKLADILEELLGPPLSHFDDETADAQLRHIVDHFAGRGFTLPVHEVEPNVWHAEWFPRGGDLGSRRTASGLSRLRAARQALAEL